MSLSASVLLESIHVQAASGGGVREGTVRALRAADPPDGGT